MCREDRYSLFTVGSTGSAEGVQVTLATSVCRLVCRRGIQREETVAAVRCQIVHAKRGGKRARFEQGRSAFDRATGTHFSPSVFDPSSHNYTALHSDPRATVPG